MLLRLFRALRLLRLLRLADRVPGLEIIAAASAAAMPLIARISVVIVMDLLAFAQVCSCWWWWWWWWHIIWPTRSKAPRASDWRSAPNRPFHSRRHTSMFSI